MGCKRCKENPVISRRYSGEILCKSCFFKSFEKNAQKELRKQINLLVKNSDIEYVRLPDTQSGVNANAAAGGVSTKSPGDQLPNIPTSDFANNFACCVANATYQNRHNDPSIVSLL